MEEPSHWLSHDSPAAGTRVSSSGCEGDGEHTVSTGAAGGDSPWCLSEPGAVRLTRAGGAAPILFGLGPDDLYPAGARARAEEDEDDEVPVARLPGAGGLLGPPASLPLGLVLASPSLAAGPGAATVLGRLLATAHAADDEPPCKLDGLLLEPTWEASAAPF